MQCYQKRTSKSNCFVRNVSCPEKLSLQFRKFIHLLQRISFENKRQKHV